MAKADHASQHALEPRCFARESRIPMAHLGSRRVTLYKKGPLLIDALHASDQQVHRVDVLEEDVENLHKILVITESIAPVRAVAAIRWTKLSKYLSREHGCDVTVLTNEKGFDGKNQSIKQYQFDSTLVDDLGTFRISFIPSSPALRLFIRLNNIALAAWNKSKSEISKHADQSAARSAIANLLRQACFIAFLGTDWLCGNGMCRTALKATLDWAEYDAVISTYGPRWPHRVAGKLKNRYPGITWIADFRDPVVSSTRSDTPGRRKYAGKVTQLADLVIGVSKGTVDNLFLTAGKPSAVLTNGFDGEEVICGSRERTDCCDFVYTGTLYADDECISDLSPLFSVLSELIESGDVDPSRVCVTYAGPTARLFDGFCTKAPNVPARSLGFLNRGDAITLQNSASALVVCTWNTKTQKGVLTGKIFEYMRSEAPVLCLCAGDVPRSDLRAIIETCHLGMCYEEADPETHQLLRDWVLGIYREWEKNGFTKRDERSYEMVKQFSYSSLASRLLGLIEEAEKRN